MANETKEIFKLFVENENVVKAKNFINETKTITCSADDASKFFITLTTLPGHTAFYSFESDAEMYDFGYRLIGAIQDNPTMKSLMKSAALERNAAFQNKTFPFVPAGFILHDTEDFPKIDYGNSEQKDFFLNNFDTIIFGDYGKPLYFPIS
ncbi:MAG: hypothetical protein K6G00_06840 [Treponema sp.]|nr:hypothetical protein [Treponema sp.]